MAKLYGLYDNDEERTDHSTADEFVGVFHLVTIGAWILFAGAWLTGLWSPELGELVFFWGAGVGLVTAGRATARAVCRQTISSLQNTIIVGAGDVGSSSPASFSSTRSTASTSSGSWTPRRRLRVRILST